MKKTLLFFKCILSTIASFAQMTNVLTPTPVISGSLCPTPLKMWDKSYGGSGYDVLTSILPVNNGGYLLGGFSHSNISGDKTQDSRGASDYWVVKIDKNGTKIWDKTFGGTNYEYLYGLLPTENGGFLLAGSTDSGASGDITDASFGSNDQWVVRIDSNGNKLWDKRYGGNNGDYMSSALATADGGYILAGETFSIISGTVSEEPRGGGDFWMVKIDANGNKLWDKRFGGSQFDATTSLIATNDGGHLLSGISNSGISGDKSEAAFGNWDYWVVKTDANGNKLWDKTFGGSGEEMINATIITSDGGYFLGGYSTSGISGNKTEASYGDMDYWLVKIDANGNKILDKSFGGGNRDRIQDITIGEDGNYILSGYSRSGISGNKTENSQGGDDFWLVKIDANANKIWDKRYGGEYNEEHHTTILTKDKEYLIGGYSGSYIYGDKTSAQRGGGDFWLVKMATCEPVKDLVAGKTYTLTATGCGGTLNWSNGATGNYITVSATGTYTATCTLNSQTSWPSNQLIIAALTTPVISGANCENKPTKIWDKQFGGGEEERLFDFLYATDGSYLAGGYSISGISGDKTQASRGSYDYWAVKMNANGNKIWDKRFGGADVDWLTCLHNTADKGYFLGGHSTSSSVGDVDKSVYPHGGEDYWLIKIDSSGNKIWDKLYGGNFNDRLQKIIDTKDGGYLLGGYSSSGISFERTQDSRGKDDFWIIKIDGEGNIIWDKRFGGNDYDRLNDMIATPDGGYLLGGSSTSNISGDKTGAFKGQSDFWVVKIDANGNKQWDKTFGGSDSDALTAISLTNDGGFLLAGPSLSSVSSDKTEASNGVYDYWVVKIDSTGNKIWDKNFGGEGYDWANSIVKTADGNYIIGGYAESGISEDKSEASKGGLDYWIVKLDDDGNTLWDKTFGSAGGEYLIKIIDTGNGNYVLGGYSQTDVPSGDRTEIPRGNGDFWMLKMTTCQPVINFCAGQTYTLKATGCSGTVVWSHGATGSSILVNAAGTYTAICQMNNQSSASSNSIVLIPSSVSLNSIATSGTVKAAQITSTQTIPSGVNATYQAGKSISLQGSFQAQTGSVFKAEIKGCE